MPAAASAAPQVDAALARLRVAGAALRRRSREDVAALLGALLEQLRDPASAIRARLAAELPAATGFTPATLAEGLARGFAPWTKEALRALVAAELETARAGRVATGFPVSAVVLGGAIPMPSVLQLVAPLALQSPVLARPGSHDRITAPAVRDALRRLDPELGACLEVLPFAHTDAAALSALARADCVVATGSDEAVAAIAARVRPWQRFVGYGHRFSLAALGREGELREACAGIAADVALWDQLGCLSPIALYALGWRWSERASLLDELEIAFAESEKRWPIGRIDVRDGATRANELATLELRAGDPDAVALRLGPRGAFALAAERDPRPRGSPLHRVLRIHFVEDTAALCAAVGPSARQLASVGIGGFSEVAARSLGQALAALGASRVCPLGQMQAPPLDWCHDGQGVLLPLARLTDLGTG